jgi:hypothetical protein
VVFTHGATTTEAAHPSQSTKGGAAAVIAVPTEAKGGPAPRRRVHEKLLPLPREDQSKRPCLHSICTLMLKLEQKGMMAGFQWLEQDQISEGSGGFGVFSSTFNSSPLSVPSEDAADSRSLMPVPKSSNS